jgi:hypothetical protein
MRDSDFRWAADLMERRRQRYAPHAPVFWRPRPGVTALHAKHLRSLAHIEGASSIRSERGFVIAVPHGDHYFIDDFAVESDDLWPNEGSDLLKAVWTSIRHLTSRIRVVAGRHDYLKKSLLITLGMSVRERWWVKVLVPTGGPVEMGTIRLGEAAAILMAAPPVYDPGGLVCFLQHSYGAHPDELCKRAAAMGAVLLVISKLGDGLPPPAIEPVLEATGFHNPSGFFEVRF